MGRIEDAMRRDTAGPLGIRRGCSPWGLRGQRDHELGFLEPHSPRGSGEVVAARRIRTGGKIAQWGRAATANLGRGMPWGKAAIADFLAENLPNGEGSYRRLLKRRALGEGSYRRFFGREFTELAACEGWLAKWSKVKKSTENPSKKVPKWLQRSGV